MSQQTARRRRLHPADQGQPPRRCLDDIHRPQPRPARIEFWNPKRVPCRSGGCLAQCQMHLPVCGLARSTRPFHCGRRGGRTWSSTSSLRQASSNSAMTRCRPRLGRPARGAGRALTTSSRQRVALKAVAREKTRATMKPLTGPAHGRRAHFAEKLAALTV